MWQRCHPVTFQLFHLPRGSLQTDSEKLSFRVVVLGIGLGLKTTFSMVLVSSLFTLSCPGPDGLSGQDSANTAMTTEQNPAADALSSVCDTLSDFSFFPTLCVRTIEVVNKWCTLACWEDRVSEQCKAVYKLLLSNWGHFLIFTFLVAWDKEKEYLQYIFWRAQFGQCDCMAICESWCYANT